MQTTLAPAYENTPEGQTAQSILRKCVHCGFCTATCPTYQLLGDELDGPRGRIYLIKQVLEGATPTRATQAHLDRCLTCRNCETTCPSGVEYGHLLDIGRAVVDAQVPRPKIEATLRWVLKKGLVSPLFAPAMALGRVMRPLLPVALKNKIPPQQSAGAWPIRQHSRKMLLLAGCVHPSMSPNINRATARVLDAAGIQSIFAPAAQCCGAVQFHLNDQAAARATMRATVDAWWPYIQDSAAQQASGVEAIVVNASGCGVHVKDYGYLLKDDPDYAAKAARVSALCKDVSELLPELVLALRDKLKLEQQAPLVYHPPCTLQHGQRLRGGVEEHLSALGFSVRLAHAESAMCCGAAGTYAVLQPDISTALRERKLGHLQAAGHEQIISANIGCISHLQSGTATPVKHWIEVLDAALAPT